MDLVSVAVILLFGFVVIFACGYAIVYAFFRDYDMIEQIAMAGVFGLAQLLVAYFLTKSFFVLGDAIVITFLLDIVLVSLSWMKRK